MSQLPPPSGKPDSSPFQITPQNAGVRPSTRQSPFTLDASAMAARPQPAIRRQYKNRPIGMVTMGPEPVEMPIEKAMAYSTGLHVFGPIITGLVIFLLLWLISLLLNINLWDFFKPKDQKHDMVFTLIEDTKAKRPDTAMMKGEFNQQAGGENDPDKPLTPPERPASPPPSAQAKPTPQVKPVPPKPQQAPQPKVVQKTDAPKPPQPKLKPLIATPKPPEKAATKAPTGPVVKSAQASHAQAAQPQQIASSSSASRPSSTGTALAAPNPEGGKGKPGVNVQADTDLGPWMSYLQRTIKRNWSPPRSGTSKRTKLMLTITRDGRLRRVEISQSSGDANSDQAAISAVQASAPFRPLPPGYPENEVPIEFDFDLNILGKN